MKRLLMKRLLIEELESRALLAAGDVGMAAMALTTNSVADFYLATVGTEIGAMLGAATFNPAAAASARRVAATGLNMRGAVLGSVEATTAVGQMTITTGANTPGIGSFAMPITGPAPGRGGGNADMDVIQAESNAERIIVSDAPEIDPSALIAVKFDRGLRRRDLG